MWYLLRISDVLVNFKSKDIWQKKKKNLKLKPFPDLGFAVVRSSEKGAPRKVEKPSDISSQYLKGNVSLNRRFSI